MRGTEKEARKLIKRFPGSLILLDILGNVLTRQGKLEDAIACYERAREIQPDHAEAHYNLGFVLQTLGRLEEAAASYQAALEINPDYAEALNNLGLACQGLGRLDEAVVSHRRALQIKPDYAEAHYNLGVVLQSLGRLDEAVASYQAALKINPNFAEPHNNLGNVLKDLGRLDEAVASYRRALRIDPASAESHNNLGEALKSLGRHDDAVASLRQALEIRPDFAEAHNSLVEVLEITNRIEALREAVADAGRHCPDHPLLALMEAQLLKREGAVARARALLEEAGDGITDADALVLRAYLLGDICDRLGDTDAAFRNFCDGNLRSRELPRAMRARAERFLARIDVASRRFTADWIASWRPIECPDGRPNPVFLIGFPRSGTTLLDTILRSHAAVSVVEEMPMVHRVRRALARLPGGDPDGLADLDAERLAELRRVYFAELDQHLSPQERSGVVVDKTPMNAVEAGLIHRIFPQARFVFAERHPCDCVLSCFMQNFELNDALVNFLDLEDAARLYDKVMTLWEHYRTVLPLTVHTLRYEMLVEAFEETLAPLVDFLGVGWDDGLRNYAETARNRDRISTASYDQVTQPLYTRARGRWERYREHMQPALPILLPWAERLGYGE